MSANPIERPDPIPPAGRYAIVASRFTESITDTLVDAAHAEFSRLGVAAKNVICIHVPGAFEIPSACRQLIQAESLQAVVALGAVIRGETPHFDFVAAECARGIAHLNLHGDVPIAFGVLTTNSYQQAQVRAGKRNSAAAAVRAAIDMAELSAQLRTEKNRPR